MTRIITIKCENDNNYYEFELGTTLQTVVNKVIKDPIYPVLGARVNNQIKDLNYDIYKPKTIKFIDITDSDGLKMYIRSLCFVLVKAVKDVFPNSLLHIKHSLSKGLYCELEYLDKSLTEEDVNNIKLKMHEIVNKNIPFRREEIETEKAIKIYEQHKLFETAKLFQNRSLLYTSVYYLEDTVGYFYGALVPSTGYLKTFDLIKYNEGMLLRFPSTSTPNNIEEFVRQDKMFEIFKEHKRGAKILGLDGIGSLNEVVKKGEVSEIIKISEALHEKKIACIADEIYKKIDKLKLILISGPSSSGKTTFSKRLAIQLRVLGLKPVLLSIDDYFVDRDKTPKDEKGDYDYENLNAIDIELLNKNILDLIDGREVLIPRFDFTKGVRQFHDKNKLKLTNNGILIIEGIHALNPNLTPMIPNEAKYKIYVSALTQISIDTYNRIPTTDNRLLRRIVRDYKYRGYTALETLKRWPSVRRGEDKNIFPYQEEADIMFNSSLMYEFGVLKIYAEPLLKEVLQNQYEFSEAKRLLKFLAYFLPIDDKEIPPTSILREFLGGSSFKY